MGATGGTPILAGAPVGPRDRDAGAVCSARSCADLGVHLIDVWDPGLRPRGDARGRRHRRAAAPPTSSQSLLDHPDCTAAHHALIGQVGMGGSPVPAAFVDRAESTRHLDRPLLRLDRAPVDHRQHARRPVELRGYTDGRPLAGVEVRLVDEDGNDVGDRRRRARS